MTIKERIQAWIKALRSGEYKQTAQCLKNQYGYCCLGVAADLLVKESAGVCFWELAPLQTDYIFQDPSSNELDATHDSMLPDDTAAKFGLREGEQDLLAGMNDSSRNTFLEIADYIEENILPRVEDD